MTFQVLVRHRLLYHLFHHQNHVLGLCSVVQSSDASLSHHSRAVYWDQSLFPPAADHTHSVGY